VQGTLSHFSDGQGVGTFYCIDTCPRLPHARSDHKYQIPPSKPSPFPTLLFLHCPYSATAPKALDPVVFSFPSPSSFYPIFALNMSDEHDLPPALAAKRTIRYADDEIEAAPERFPSGIPWSHLHKPSRRSSMSSLRSERSMSRNVDPALALPAVYRTVSFNITTTQERNAEASKEAKLKTTDGKSFSRQRRHR
jgi:hypothetical protein